MELSTNIVTWFWLNPYKTIRDHRLEYIPKMKQQINMENLLLLLLALLKTEKKTKKLLENSLVAVVYNLRNVQIVKQNSNNFNSGWWNYKRSYYLLLHQ